MSRKRIFNVIKKEWLVMISDVSSTLLITLLPLLIMGEFLVVVWLISRFGGQSVITTPVIQGAMEKMRLAIPGAASLTDSEQLQLFLLYQFNFYLLIIPTMIAISVATFNIVDEKVSGSLEALLATPVRTWELLLGKALSGAIPALLVTWICGAIFLGGVSVMGWGNLVSLVINPAWFIFLFLLTPVVALLSFLLGVIGSSRAKDARSAQNLVILIVLPVMALIALQVTGVIWFSPLNSFVLALLVGIVDTLVLRLAVRLFQRETIVSQWR